MSIKATDTKVPEWMVGGMQARIIRAEDVKPKDLDPVWPGFLWAGKPTMLAGDPGLGKSMVTCDIAARITTGAPWPCSTGQQQPANVVMLSAEDDLEDTIVPRLTAAGADLTRIIFIRDITAYTKDGPTPIWLSLDKHMEHLAEVLRAQRGQTRLLIIDPLAAYLGHKIDSHNNSDVRTVLGGLAQLAAEHNCAVLAVSHLRKSDSSTALYRVTGSLAFTAAVRSVYFITKDPVDDDRRLMLCAKNNLALSSFGFSYLIKANDDNIPYVEWSDEPETRSIDELLGDEQSPRQTAKNNRITEIKEWINLELAHGPAPAAEMWNKAKEHGYSERDVRAAQKALKVETEIVGFQGNWHWRLPVAE